jgi:glycosyltransferase involved in cell wall biosynthesis
MGGGIVAPLQVAVNLLWCSPGRVGGSEEYLTRQLQGITALHDQAPDNLEMAITVYASQAFAHAHRDLAESFTIRSPKWPVDSQALRIITEHTWLPAATRGVDLVHHAGGTMPVIGAGLQVVTIHDLQYLTYPEYFSQARLRYLRHMVPRSVARASMVLVPSHYVRTRILDMFGAEPDRVRVAPHGIAPHPHELSGSDWESLRSRYGLGDGPVYVYPAITHPHKNHQLLLTAMARHWHDPDLRLVLLGGRGTAEAEVAQMISNLGLSQRVIRPGRVPAADRDGLIALADALVFPSRYEGFGAPLIEAMALGTPVVACDLTAISEVVGEAGWLLPDDPDAWADLPALIRAEGQARVSAGLIRSREFSLENSARALLDAYRSTSDLGSMTRGAQK